MNRFDNESRRTAEARNGNGGELGAAARELSKIAVEETKRITGLSQRTAYRKRLFEMRRGLNGEYRRNYALAAGSVFCGAVGEVLVNEYYRVEKQLRIAAAEAERLKFGRLPCFAAGEAAGSLRCAVLAKKLCELCGGAPGIGSVVEFFDEYQQNRPLTTREIQLLPAMLRRAELETLYGIVCTLGDGPLGTGRAAALQNVLAALSRIDDVDFSECIQNLNITWRMQRIFRLPMSQRSSFILKRRPKFRNGHRRRNRPWFGRRSNYQRGGRGAALLWAAVCLRKGSRS